MTASAKVRQSRTSAIVLGGASGLGMATSAMLSRRVASVVVADIAEEQRQAVEAVGDNVTFIRTDATKPEEIRAAVEFAASQAPLSIAVSTAGVMGRGRVLSSRGPMPMVEFEHVVKVNLVGSAALVVHAAEAMAASDDRGSQGGRDTERGLIVLTASIAGLDGGNFAYAASKAGVAGMTLSAAHDLAPYGIRVMCIAPGIFRTPMFDTAGPAIEALANDVPFPRRLGDPEEFAALIGHIADNKMFNGEVVRLDAALRVPRVVRRTPTH